MQKVDRRKCATRRRSYLCWLSVLLLVLGIGMAQYSQPNQVSFNISSKPFPQYREVTTRLRQAGWPFVWYKGMPTVNGHTGYVLFRARLGWDIALWLCALASVYVQTMRFSWTVTLLGMLVALTAAMVTFRILLSVQWYATVPLMWFFGVCTFLVVLNVLEVVLRAAGWQCWHFDQCRGAIEGDSRQ